MLANGAVWAGELSGWFQLNPPADSTDEACIAD